MRKNKMAKKWRKSVKTEEEEEEEANIEEKEEEEEEEDRYAPIENGKYFAILFNLFIAK